MRAVHFSVLTVLAVIGLFCVPLIQFMELASYDARLHVESRIHPMAENRELLIIGIDDQSLENYGRWPWPRSYLAEIIDVLSEFQVRGVFLDIAMPEPATGLRTGSLVGHDFGDAVLAVIRAQLDVLTGVVDRVVGDRDGTRPQEASDPDRTKPGERSGPAGRETAQAGEAASAARSVVLRSNRVLEEKVLDLLPGSPDRAVAESLAAAARAGAFTVGLFTVDPGPPPAPRDGAGSAADDAKAHELVAWLRTRFEAGGSPGLWRYLPDLDEAAGRLIMDRGQALRQEVLRQISVGFLGALPDPARTEARELLEAFSVRFPQLGDLGVRVFDREVARRAVLARHGIELDGSAKLDRMPRGRNVIPPVAVISQALRALGCDNRSQDRDGSLRSVPLFWTVGDSILTSAVLRLILAVSDAGGPGGTPLRVRRGPSIEAAGVAGSSPVHIPVTADGRMLVHWSGPFDRAFERISASPLLDYAAARAKRDLFFRTAFNDPVEKFIRRFEVLARSLMLQDAGALFSLTALGQALLERWSFLAEEDLQVAITELLAAGREEFRELDPPATAGESRSAQRWYRFFVGRRRAREQARIQVLRDGLERVEQRYRDPVKRAKKKQGYLDALRPFEEVDATLARLRAELESRIRGRICLVGSTASSSTDLSSMPFGKLEPNVGMYASALNTFMSRRFLSRPGWLSWRIGALVDPDVLQLPLLLLVALIMPLVLFHFSARAGALFAGGFVAAWMGFTTLLFIRWGLWIDVVAPIVATGVSYLLIYTWKHVRTEHVRRVFESYVDPQIVSEVVDNEDLWKKLGGIEQEISPFFSDVAGFTTLSEMLPPEELSNMLTDYLSPMTRVIHANRGTLDKYIGDAIVAFFGSPVKSDEHAFLACRAAIEQQALLVELKKTWQDRNWYRLVKGSGMDMMFRVGLNTGSAKVGNFGSETNKNYTMIGDTVNLAARLEGANKQYGTLVMAAEATREACGDRIVFRELDRLKVKGKTEAVLVYEVVGIPGQIESSWDGVREEYGRGLELYYARAFAQARGRFGRVLEIRPGDGPARLYLERAEQFLENPPPDEWDGVFVMTTK